MSLDLDPIKARADAATEGPWGVEDARVFGDDGRTQVCTLSGTRAWLPDAEFIAHARTDIPALIAEVERLRELCEEKDAAFQYATDNARRLTPCEISEVRKRQVERSMAQVKRLTTELNNHRESLNNQRREYRKLLAKRDAEVERLRGRIEALHPREVIAVHEGYGEEAWCPECRFHYPCQTIRALEGK